MKKIIFHTFALSQRQEVKFVPPRFKLDLQFFSGEEEWARQTLGLPLEEPITVQEIRKAYKEKSKKNLDNRNREEAEKKFEEIDKAWDILTEEIERKEWRDRPESINLLNLADALVAENNQLERKLKEAAYLGLSINEENERLKLKVNESERNFKDQKKKKQTT